MLIHQHLASLKVVLSNGQFPDHYIYNVANLYLQVHVCTILYMQYIALGRQLST